MSKSLFFQIIDFVCVCVCFKGLRGAGVSGGQWLPGAQRGDVRQGKEPPGAPHRHEGGELRSWFNGTVVLCGF